MSQSCWHRGLEQALLKQTERTFVESQDGGQPRQDFLLIEIAREAIGLAANTLRAREEQPPDFFFVDNPFVRRAPQRECIQVVGEFLPPIDQRRMHVWKKR